jgi:hypothetical protein
MKWLFLIDFKLSFKEKNVGLYYFIHILYSMEKRKTSIKWLISCLKKK